MKERTACALCAGEAALFCEPDAAFLCWACDASVHSANFLVARHVRLLACTSCRSVDARRCVSGPDPTQVQHLCASCDHLAPPSPSRSSSSSICCLSTSDSAVAPRAQKAATTGWRKVGGAGPSRMGTEDGAAEPAAVRASGGARDQGVPARGSVLVPARDVGCGAVVRCQTLRGRGGRAEDGGCALLAGARAWPRGSSSSPSGGSSGSLSKPDSRRRGRRSGPSQPV